MRILIYFTTNGRAVDQQSVMEMFCKQGHEVYLLTHLPKGDLHHNVEKYGVKTFSAGLKKNTGFLSYIKHTRLLVSFIKEHKIDVVFAHLQTMGLIASMARWFTRFRLFYIRHNTDEHILVKNRNAIIVNRLVNLIAPVIIAPSEKVYNYVVQTEKVNSKKIRRINYGYNFNQYLETDKTGTAEQIRLQFPARMLIVSIARLIPAKRHLLIFDAVGSLLNDGYDIKLICLGNGWFKQSLEDYITGHNFSDRIFLLGSKSNVFDYLEAGDVFLHLSETEASNSAVKEAGFCRKPVIVCEDVGDFSDYIKNRVNGFLISKNNPVPAAIEALCFCYNKPGTVADMGQRLYETITEEFSIDKVAPLYDDLLCK